MLYKSSNSKGNLNNMLAQKKGLIENNLQLNRNNKI